MSDKPLVQQALASELAEILLNISTTQSSLAFLRGFWEATVREWNSIDRLRLVHAVIFVFSCFTNIIQDRQILHAYSEIRERLFQALDESRVGQFCVRRIQLYIHEPWRSSMVRPAFWHCFCFY